MRLSDAMRKGITMVAPLQTGELFYRVDDDEFDYKSGPIVRACAIGTIVVAICEHGINHSGVSSNDTCDLTVSYPELDNVRTINPATNRNQTIREIMIELNDVLYWKREQIADWLAEQGY